VIVKVDEGFDDRHRFRERFKLVRPDNLFFKRFHEALGVGISFRIVVAGCHVNDTQRCQFFLIPLARRLRTVVGHQMDLIRTASQGTSILDSLTKRRQPKVGRRPQANAVTYRALGIPIEYHDQIHPAHLFDIELGHVGSPPLVHPGGTRLGACDSPFRCVSLHSHRQAELTHNASDPLAIGPDTALGPQIGADATVSPEGMRSGCLTNDLKELGFLSTHRLFGDWP